jgi:hypothetical protein
VQSATTTGPALQGAQATVVGIDFFSGLQQHIDPAWGYAQRQPDPPVYFDTSDYEWFSGKSPNPTPVYPDTQWQGDSAAGLVNVNAPVVQPLTSWYYQNIHASIQLQITGVPNGTPYLLEGSSGVASFSFRQPGQVAVNPNTNIGTVASVVGQAPLPPVLQTGQVTINWKLTLNPGTPQAQALPLGSTVHIIDTIFAPPVNADNPVFPSNELTDQRLFRAIAWANDAVTKAGGLGANPEVIAQKLIDDVFAVVGFDSQSTADHNNYWLTPGAGLNPIPAGSVPPKDCISQASFASWVAWATGLPGNYSVKTFTADVFEGDNSNPFQAVWGALEKPQTLPPGANPAYFQEVDYQGDPNKRLWLIDANGSKNAFEATLAFQADATSRNLYIIPGQLDAKFTDGTPDATTYPLSTLLKTLFQGVGYYDSTGKPVFVYPYSNKTPTGSGV